MSSSSNGIGPHRTLKNNRTDKPYSRQQPTPQPLRRTSSIVDSFKSLVTKPFSWFSSSKDSSRDQQDDTPIGSKRSEPSRKGKEPSLNSRPTKRTRRKSPAHVAIGYNDPSPALFQRSVPPLSTLPPLPPSPARSATPRRQNRPSFAADYHPAMRTSPSVRSSPHRPLVPRRSVLPEPMPSNAFGMSSKSPFIRSNTMPTIPLQTNPFQFEANLPLPRTSFAQDDQRMRTQSPGLPQSPSRRNRIPSFTTQPMSRSQSLMSVTSPLSPSFPPARPSILSSSVVWNNNAGPIPPASSVSAKNLQKQKAANPEQAATDRVLQALEEAVPWSEARKLRHEQRASVKVPTPSTSTSLKGRAARMVNPYARHAGDEPTKKGVLSKLAEKKKAGHDARKVSAYRPEAPPVPDADAKTDVDAPNDEEMEDETPVRIEPPPESKRVRKVAKVEAPSSRPSSSLRAGREKAGVHQSAPQLKTRPNRFAMPDDEEEEEDDGLPDEQELQAWANKKGVAFEVPAGWKFGDEQVGGASAKETQSGQLVRRDSAMDTDAAAPEQALVIVVPEPKSKPSPFPLNVPSAFQLPARLADKDTATNTPDLIKEAEPIKPVVIPPPKDSLWGTFSAPIATTPAPTPAAAPSSAFSLAPPVTKSPAPPSLFAGFGGLPAAKPADTDKKASEPQPAPAFAGFGSFNKTDEVSKPSTSVFGVFGAAPNLPEPKQPEIKEVEIKEPEPAVEEVKELPVEKPTPVVSWLAKPSFQFQSTAAPLVPTSTPNGSPAFSFGKAINGFTAPVNNEKKDVPSLTFPPPTPESSKAVVVPTIPAWGAFGKPAGASPSVFGAPTRPPGLFTSPSDKPAQDAAPLSADAPKAIAPPSTNAPVAVEAPAENKSSPWGTSFGAKPAAEATTEAGSKPVVSSPFSFAPVGSAPPPVFGGFGNPNTQPTTTPASEKSDPKPTTFPMFGMPPSQTQAEPAKPVLSGFGMPSTPGTPSAPGSRSATLSSIPNTVANPSPTNAAPPSTASPFNFGSNRSVSAAPSSFSNPTFGSSTKTSLNFNFGAPAAVPTFGVTPPTPRPKTPPNTGSGDAAMETSPIRPTFPSITTTTSPFGFAPQSSATFPATGGFGSFAAPKSTFSFGAPAAPAGLFGASTPNPFGQSSSQPSSSPSSPFTQPIANPFAASASAPVSPFQQPTALLANPAASLSPAQSPSFNFATVPAVQSPTTPSSSGPSFVFGAGADTSSAQPRASTPTTPQARRLKGLPNRRKR